MPPSFPPGDPDHPASARIYSYLLGSTDWYPCDRELAEKLKAACPPARWMASDNAVYLGRCAQYAVCQLGIAQILDLGSGFPGPMSVREYAQAVDPNVTVACVDHDPLVAGEDGYGPLLETRFVRNVNLIQADIADPAAVLGDPGVTGLLDLEKPVLAVLGLVLHNLPAKKAREVVAGYADALSAGSALAVTVMRSDDAAEFAEVCDLYACEGMQEPVNFEVHEVEALFGDLEILSPGVGPVSGCVPGWTRMQAAARGVHIAGVLAIKRLP